MKRKQIVTVILLEDGCIDMIKVYDNEEKAFTTFSQLVVQKGFRIPYYMETLSEYEKAFNDWEDSDKCTYDVMDWNIQIWRDYLR